MGARLPTESRWGGLILFSALQGVGSLATLACTLLLAHTSGPAVQGAFSGMKAQIEFLSASLVVGLPQALFYAVHHGSLGRVAAVKTAILHSLVATVIALVLVEMLNLPAGAYSPAPVASVAIAAVAGLAVCYAALRGAMLAYRSYTMFSLLSAAPSVLLLVFIATGLSAGVPVGADAEITLTMFAFTYLLSTVLALGTAISRGRRDEPGLSWRAATPLYRYGFATWLAAAAQSASSYFALYWLGSRLHDPVAVGVFAAGLALVTIATAPLNLAAPVLFKQWIGSHARQRGREAVQLATLFAVIALVLGVAAWFGRDALVGVVFGEDYVEHSVWIVLLAVAIPTQGILKLWGVTLNAEGRPGVAAGVEVARLVAIVGGILLFGTHLANVVCVWIAAEIMSLVLTGLVAWSRAKCAISSP